MANFEFDQAEGLRRLLAGPRPQMVTVLSAAGASEKHALLLNLCASLAGTGSRVMLVDACCTAQGVAHAVPGALAPTLLQAARGQCGMNETLRTLPQGYLLGCLARAVAAGQLAASERDQLAFVLDELAARVDITVVDADGQGEGLILPAMTAGSLLVQVTDNPTAIQEGYGMIKRVTARFGRCAIGVLVTGTSEARAKVIFQNMAQAARRYLALELQSLGSVPQDDHLARAVRLNRSVIDAFPLAGASVALRRLAGRLAEGCVAPAMR